MNLVIGLVTILVAVWAKANDHEDYLSPGQDRGVPYPGRIYWFAPGRPNTKRETRMSKDHAAAFLKGYARNACYCMKKETCPDAQVQDCKADFKCCTMDEIHGGINLEKGLLKEKEKLSFNKGLLNEEEESPSLDN